MFIKIAFGNVRRSLRDFSIYFVTLSLSIMMFYSFNALLSQGFYTDLSPDMGRMYQLMKMFIQALSVLIGVIVMFLVVSSNLFFMKRRRREFATYILLGMKKMHLALIILIENVLCAVVSLIVGLGLGILVSQFTSPYISSLFDFPPDMFTFSISQEALLFTTELFCVIFAVSSLITSLCISRVRLAILFKSSLVSDRFKLRNPYVLFALFVVSLVCIGYSYSLLKFWLSTHADSSVFAQATLFVTLGTALFFFSLSGFIVVITKSIKPLYLRGLNCYVVRQFAKSVNSAWASLTLVCATVFVALCGLSLGFAVVSSIDGQLKDIDTSRVMVMADTVDNDKLSAGEGALAADSTSAADYDIARYVSTHVDHWNDYVAYTAGFRFYSTLGKEFENSDAKDAAKTLFKQIIAHHSETAAPTVRPAHNTDASAQNQSEHGFSIFSTPADSSNDNDAESAAIPSELKGYTNILYMKVSEVNALLQHLGKPTVSLADNQVALLALMEPSYKALAPYVTGDIPVGVGGHNITLTTLLDYNDFVGIFTGYPITLVVPDSFIDNSSQLYGCSAIGFLKDTSREAQQSFIRDVLGTSKHPATWENNIQAPWNKISIVNLYQVVVMGSVLKGIGSFMAIYLGLILLVAAACLLAIQQLTQALDTRHDYTKLLQLGATTGMASRALFAQVCFYFFVPAALALVHALQFITAIKVEIGSLSQAGGILAQILAVVLVGYIGYFVICYIISRSICLKQAS
ncbi:efflux ABC transporter, permease protein [Umbribacter vaginalis]|nr:efflux ABC transporter, permease protein [Coriobacteriales bacterium DNF00809]